MGRSHFPPRVSRRPQLSTSGPCFDGLLNPPTIRSVTQSDKGSGAGKGSGADKGSSAGKGTNAGKGPGQGSGPDAGSGRDAEAVRAARPALLVAGVVLGVEAVSVVVYGILVAVNLHDVVRGVGYGVAGMLVAWGIALALVGRGVVLARHWARGPAVALQLFQFPLAWGFRANLGWVAVALFVTAAIVLICVFLPASTAAFTGGRKLPGEEP